MVELREVTGLARRPGQVGVDVEIGDKGHGASAPFFERGIFKSNRQIRSEGRILLGSSDKVND